MGADIHPDLPGLCAGEHSNSRKSPSKQKVASDKQLIRCGVGSATTLPQHTFKSVGLLEAEGDRRGAHNIRQGIMNMKCPFCATGNLVRDTRDLLYLYKGRATNIPAVTGDFCSQCKEVILDSEESACTSQAMLAFKEQVDVSRR